MGNNPPLPANPSSSSTTTSHRRRRIERFYNIVWCDPTIGNERNARDDTYTVLRLKRIVNRKRQVIHAFNTIDECKSFIEQINNVCLIVSGSVGQALVPMIHQLEQISMVFVFCMNYQKNIVWAKHYKKVRGVYTKIEEICGELSKEYFPPTPNEYERIQFDLLKSSWEQRTHLDDDDHSFFNSVSTKILLSRANSSEQTMFDFFKNQYPGENEEKLLSEFQRKFSPSDAIFWFTKDRFFQEILNQPLRMNDFYPLISIEYFIRLINNQIENLYRRTERSNQILTLYVSHTLPNNDFKRLEENRSSIIYFNEFFFANTEKSLACLFLNDETLPSDSSTMKNILFEIQIPPTDEPTGFYANIGANTRFTHEKDYLFSNGPFFRVEHVLRLDDYQNAAQVRLVLLDKHDSQYLSLMQIARTRFVPDDLDLDSLSASIKRLSTRFRLNRFIFQEHLNWSREHIRTVLQHLNLAFLRTFSHRPDHAIRIYENLLNFLRSSISTNHPDRSALLAPLHSLKGQAHQINNQPSIAFDEAYNALTILLRRENQSEFSKMILSSAHSNLASILEQQNRFSESVSHYGASLKILQEFLPVNHPDLLELKTMIERASSMRNVDNARTVSSSSMKSFVQTTAL